MGSGSDPSTETVDPRTEEQKMISKYLAGILPGRMEMDPMTGEEIDLALMGKSWTEGVYAPMMQAFQTYAVPEITQGFREGGLFSKARGDAIARSLEGLQGTLTSELASRNWAATLQKTAMIERQYYDSPAGIQEALSFLGTPGMEVVGFQGTEGPDYLGAGAMIYGMGVGGSVLGGAGMAKAMFFCIPEGSLIDTPDGQKKVEDIRAGDSVIDKDNKPVNVLMKYEFDVMPTDDRFIELIFEDNSKATVCDMHEIDGVKVVDLVLGDKGLISKETLSMNARSYDLLTTGRDGGYSVNGVGLDSMIPKLQELTTLLTERKET